MAEKEVKIEIKGGKYNGHSIKANKSVDTGFIFPYSELTKCLQLLQLLNENITVMVKIGANKPKEIGLFMLKEFKVASDGECTLKLNSSLDYVEQNSFNDLAGEILTVRFKAEIDQEEEEDEDDEE